MLPILLALLFIAIIFIIVIAGRPTEFCITRSVTISAPSEKVFAQVNDLHAWEAWSPWAKLDPNAKSTYEGPASGKGAIMRWSGNNKIGEGSMTIIESRTNELIRFKLEFQHPFKATNMAEFVFQSRGEQTVVNWSMVGINDFGGKIFGLIMNCEDIAGKDFDRGLVNLKSVVATK